MSSSDVTVRITYGDEDNLEVLVEYTVTYWGYPGSGPSFSGPGDPPEPPEFEINKITFEQEGQVGEIDWDTIEREYQDLIDEAIYEQLAEGPPEPDYD